jgi:Fe-S cluster biogenesis protein NfuA
MNKIAELNSNLERLNLLLGQVEQLADPLVRRTLEEILQGVMEFHAAGITRLLEIVGSRAPSDVLEEAGKDDLVSSLLSLYDLHPLDLTTRVEWALDQARPYLKSHGGSVELVGIDEGTVRLRLDGSCHGCPSSMATVKGSIEESIRAMVPEIGNVEVEGLMGQSSQADGKGFVPLTVLAGTNGHGRL